MKPTLEQQAIIDAATSRPVRNLAISAYAGAGKTATLVMLAKALPKQSLYIAFNKSIAEEASELFPVWVTCKTLHSLAYAAVITPQKMFRKVAGYSDTKAILRLLDKELGYLPDYMALEAVYFTLEVIKEFCQSASFDLAGFVYWYMVEQGIQLEYDMRLPSVLKLWEAMTDPKSTITMTHDVYLKLFQLSKPVLDFDVIYQDEFQDANPVTLDIFYRQKCQLVAVGDPYQSIYEWRGAVDAFKTIPEDWVKLKLTESFRFTPEIASIATKLLHIAGEDSPVVGLGKAKGDGSRAILCRTNLDILTHLLAAKNAKEKVFVMADLADLWSKLYHISSLSSGSKPKYPNRQLKMFSNMDELVKEAEHNHEFKKLLNFGTLLASGKGLHANIVDIKEVVVDKQEDAAYTIATLHRSKGLEYDHVTIDSNAINLDQEDLTIAEILADGQLLNLLYVGVTRARASLSSPDELHEVISMCGMLRDEYLEVVG